MDRKNAIIALLAVLLIFCTATSYLSYQQQQHMIAVQGDIIENLISARNAGNAGRAENPAFINGSEAGSSSSANIVAVRSDTHSGVIGKVYVELKDGNGDVLVNTNPFVEPDTQYSVREAVAIAENFTNINVSNKDIVVSFAINGTLIGGPSAGAATTVATIAAMEGAQVRQDVAITGTIEEGGYIGQVGGVFDKAVAAEKNGMTLFLVPNGQKKLIYYEQQTEERDIFGFTFTRVYYTPKEIDLGEYMEGTMDVEEVSTIGEAVTYMIAEYDFII
ncbi:MAG: S16 family serine protease [Euryarchaeota archaeon]|nr:S16 family serine protease [Euryarchaeota archaeon]